jgi:hypothetical protein
MRQGNRIGATRDTDDETGARRQQVLPPDGALNVLMETSHSPCLAEAGEARLG